MSRRLILPAVQRWRSLSQRRPRRSSAAIPPRRGLPGPRLPRGRHRLQRLRRRFLQRHAVGSRQFLTAARCTTNLLGQPRQPSTASPCASATSTCPIPRCVQYTSRRTTSRIRPIFHLRLREADGRERRRDAHVHDAGRRRPRCAVVDALRPRPGLRSAAGAPSWAGGRSKVDKSPRSLLTGDVVRRADADCRQPQLRSRGHAVRRRHPRRRRREPLPERLRAALYSLPDGTGFALAGVFSGEACATADAPGVFARVGADAAERLGPRNARRRPTSTSATRRGPTSR